MLGGDCCGAVGSLDLKRDGCGFREDGSKAFGGRDCGYAG